MESRVLTAVLLSTVLTVANGGTDNSDRPEMGAPDLTHNTLCYKCMAIDPGHRDITRDTFLKNLFPPNQGCLDGDTKNMTVFPCLGKCVDYRANVTGSDSVGEYTFDVMARGCDLVPWDTTDDCTSLPEQYIAYLKGHLPGSNLVTGQRCSSSIPTISCFECNDISVAGSVHANPMKELIKAHPPNQACREGDTKKMKTRPCIGQCKIFVANLTGSDDHGEYKMNMVTRTCEIAPPGATDDCLKIGDARINDFKEDKPSITSINGQDCYCSTEKCNLTPVTSVQDTSTQDNNGQIPTISCFQCTDISVAGSVHSNYMKKVTGNPSNQACRDGDSKRMQTMSCMGKCMLSVTNLTRSDDGKEYKVNMVSRTCDMPPSRATDDCIKISDARINDLKERMANITSIEGQECYCSTDKCNLTPDTLTQHNNGQVMLTPALIMCFLSLVITF